MNFKIPVDVPDWIFYAIVGCMILFIISLIYLKLLRTYYHNQTKRWLSTRGIVLDSTCRTNIIGLSPSGFIVQGGYKVMVKYSYSVDGVDYIGNRISYNDGIIKDHSLAQRIAENYSLNDEITVFYNPVNPKLAVLKPLKL